MYSSFYLECPHCGAKLRKTDVLNTFICDYCKGEILISDDNNKSINVSIDDAEKIGYELEKGKLQAIREDEAIRKQNLIEEEKQEKGIKRRRFLLKFLAWILFFPIIIIYKIIRSNKLDFEAKFFILGIIIIIIIFIINGGRVL